MRWANGQIDVLGFAGTLGMLRGNPNVYSLIDATIRRGPGAAWRFLRTLWDRYDIALITQPSDRADLYGAVAARLRWGIVLPEPLLAWWKRVLLTYAVTSAGDRGDVHSAQEKPALLDSWQRDSTLPDVVPPTAAMLPEAIGHALQPAPIVVHVPSMWRYTQWPVEHFEVLVDALLDEAIREC